VRRDHGRVRIRGAAASKAVEPEAARILHDNGALRGLERAQLRCRAAARQRTLVVATHKTDVYGRYVADLFFHGAEVTLLECFSKGTYLNRH